jgi:RNA polymerase sigma-70 factor (ECF subfamily)
MAVPNDAALIAATLQGDTHAFGLLVRQHQDRVFTAVYHVVGDRQEAEDLTQDAFVKAFVNLASFKGQSSFFTWIYRIAFNLAATRRQRKRPWVSLEARRESLGPEPLDTSEPAEEHLIREERAAETRAALAELPEEFREILVLREIEGCDYHTIAEILSTPIGTVRSRLHRARLELRNRLQARSARQPTERP